MKTSPVLIVATCLVIWGLMLLGPLGWGIVLLLLYTAFNAWKLEEELKTPFLAWLEAKEEEEEDRIGKGKGMN